MIDFIEEEDSYAVALDLMKLLSKFSVDSSKFYTATILQECSQFERCNDCDNLQEECNCSEPDEPLSYRRYNPYDDDSDQE